MFDETLYFLNGLACEGVGAAMPQLDIKYIEPIWLDRLARVPNEMAKAGAYAVAWPQHPHFGRFDVFENVPLR